jgi:ribosomal small subunit protein bTHX
LLKAEIFSDLFVISQDFTIIATQKKLFMGKGDKKSKKGKIWRDSYGNSRRKKLIKAKLKRTASNKPAATTAEEKPKRATKKA